ELIRRHRVRARGPRGGSRKRAVVQRVGGAALAPTEVKAQIAHIAARVAAVDLPAAGAELLDRDRTEARDAVAHSPHPALEPSERQDVELGRRSPGSQSSAGRAGHVVPGAHQELLATWSQRQLPVQARLAALEQVVPAT